jgi:hypothetical protein
MLEPAFGFLIRRGLRHVDAGTYWVNVVSGSVVRDVPPGPWRSYGEFQ